MRTFKTVAAIAYLIILCATTFCFGQVSSPTPETNGEISRR